ncbi:unnamed protein product [Cuscuta europaea]|uniref:Uncharacterized protein n=1 Tax=Cuscuta europaea TaxID=41803 RepID=A0A9P1A0E4_CUSEU|nr:unnamed protein product [Cuscuta europaea]
MEADVGALEIERGGRRLILKKKIEACIGSQRVGGGWNFDSHRHSCKELLRISLSRTKILITTLKPVNSHKNTGCICTPGCTLKFAHKQVEPNSNMGMPEFEFDKNLRSRVRARA